MKNNICVIEKQETTRSLSVLPEEREILAITSYILMFEAVAACSICNPVTDVCTLCSFSNIEYTVLVVSICSVYSTREDCRFFCLWNQGAVLIHG